MFNTPISPIHIHVPIMPPIPIMPLTLCILLIPNICHSTNLKQRRAIHLSFKLTKTTESQNYPRILGLQLCLKKAHSTYSLPLIYIQERPFQLFQSI